MNRKLLIILACFISFPVTHVSFAAPMLYRVQQQKMMKQQQEQEMTIEKHQAYLLYLQQQQGNHQQAAPPTYQQIVDQRNQVIAQSILNAHNKSVSVNEQSGGSGVQQGPAPPQPAAASAGPEDDRNVVDLSEVWKKMDTRSTIWTAIDDNQAKVATVTEFIGRFQKEGVKISEPAEHYAEMIDQVSQQNPQMLQRPLGGIIQILAIIDYDFDNGTDKDALAKQVLGQAGYETNKQRLIQQQQAMQQQQQQQQQQ